MIERGSMAERAQGWLEIRIETNVVIEILQVDEDIIHQKRTLAREVAMDEMMVSQL